MHAVRMPLVQAAMQDRLEVMLRHVDDEGIARLVGQQVGAHRRPRDVGGALDIADLVDAQGLRQHLVGDAVAAEGLQRAGQDGAGLGVARQAVVFLEQLERQAVEAQAQRGRQARPGPRPRSARASCSRAASCDHAHHRPRNRQSRATAPMRSWWRRRRAGTAAGRPRPPACRRRSNCLPAFVIGALDWRRDIAGCRSRPARSG